VEDDGFGISDEIKDKVFEPFVTTKPNGTGLGMAITYRIVTDIGGNISIEKSNLGGASFKIYIPTRA
ncbi:MAG: ATP-binding protein, partial [Thermodesulfovibrionales bacterium]|nr:ATP-binding protein [Thermodesulfovibrionales bacterium]